MSNYLTFILKLQDMLTPEMRRAASVSESSANKITSQFTGVQYAGKKMAHSVYELRSALEQMNTIRFGTHIKGEFEAATAGARKLEKQIEKLENKGSKKSGSGVLGMGGLIKGNLITGAITQGISMAKDLGVDVYETSLKNSSLKTAINSTTGGQGQKAIAMTSNIADKYGLNYEASLEGVKTLTGGLKGMNMPLEEQMKIFEGVSTGVAAMKLGAEESKGAMLALGQMASKGTVSAEELRGQLGERIPGAFHIAADAMGVTEKELGKMMKKGDIAAKDFLPRFATEMQKAFGADALAAANGPQAIQERFNNAIFKMKASVGDGLMPIITPLIQKFTELAVTVMPYIQTGIEFLRTTINDIWTYIKGIWQGTGDWGSYLATAKDIVLHMWNAMKSIAGNVWHILGGIIQWISKSELMKDLFKVIGKIAGFLYDTVAWIGDKIQWMWDNIIKPILDKVEWVYSHIKGFFGGGKTTIEVVDGTVSQKAFSAIPGMGGGGAYPLYQPAAAAAVSVNPILLNTDKGNKPNAKDILGNEIKEKSSSINSGGQRSIIINIGKQIEKLEVHVMDAKEGVNEIENMVRESMRRLMYSLNGVATS